VSVEGFSEKDAAHILEVTEAELKALVDDAGREMASQIAANVLIIEDEMLIATDLEQVVARLGHRVIGIARTRSDALARAREDNPGLILADIQLADGSSGLDAVNDLLDTFEVPVMDHHGLSEAISDRRASRTGFPPVQALSAVNGVRAHQPSAFL
jgi:CheY-like chemotaxis protein